MPNKGMGVMIAFGKPKGGPPPLDSPGKKYDDSRDAYPGKPNGPAHESAEMPEHEAAEENGGSMLTELDSLSDQYGLDASSGRAFVKAALAAMAKFMGGEEERQPVDHDAGGENFEGAE